MRCPADGECQDIVEVQELIKKRDRTLFGEDGMGGIVGTLKSKADKTCLIDYIKKPHPIVWSLLFVLVLAPIFNTIYNLSSGQKLNPYVYAKKEKVNEINTQQQVLVQQIKHIKGDVEEIKISQKEMKADFKANLNEIKELIKGLAKP